MPVYTQLDQSDFYLALAHASLYQLLHNSFFAQPGTTVTDLQQFLGAVEGSQTWNYGEQISILRPKLTGDAQDYNPRSGVDASVSPVEYVNIPLKLEKLFTKGFHVYAHDSAMAQRRNIVDVSKDNGGAIAASWDKYVYNNCFREHTPTTGTDIELAGIPPLAIVSDLTGTTYNAFNNSHLTNADSVMGEANVPFSDRYIGLSPRAKADFIGDSVMVTGFAAASVGGSQIIQGGMPTNSLVQRYGFNVGSANVGADASQSAVATIVTGAVEQITAVAADTTIFFEGDQSAATPIGAVRLTIADSGSIDTGVAVGQILRIENAANTEVIGHGVILRIDTDNRYIWTVPYAPNGTKLVADQITAASDEITIPAIGSVNVAYHNEHVVVATRPMLAPSQGSGAIMRMAPMHDTGTLIQMYSGGFNVDGFSEKRRSAMLCGSTPTDYRKGVLLLSR